MPKIFENQAVGYGDQVIFSTVGKYSMDTAVQILEQLERNFDCEIADDGWNSSGYGRLVEIGIPVRLANIEFLIICSHDNILIKRVSGNKGRFYDICESVRNMDLMESADTRRENR